MQSPASAYDSGWRELRDSLTNGWVAAAVQVRRAGQWGVLRFHSLSGSVASSTYFAQFPAGFFVGNQNMLIGIRTTTHNIWVPSSGDRLSLPTSVPVSSAYVTIAQFVGDTPLPATLPGVDA